MVSRRFVMSFIGFLTLGLVVALPGCSAKQEAEVKMRKDCLSKLGLAYRAFQEENKHGPEGIEDFAKYVESTSIDEVATEAVKRLREGDIMFYWNRVLPPEGSAGDDVLLGYEPTCAARGGYVVTADAFVKLVKREEFEALEILPEWKAEP